MKLTRDEILNMPAGRGLDALIAIKLLGLSVEHLPVVYEEGYTEDGTDGWSGFVCPRCRRPEDMLDEPCAKNYSTDISAAWKVVDKLNRDGWYVSVFTGHKFECALSHPNPKRGNYCKGETAPLAICRAALLAVTDTYR